MLFFTVACIIYVCRDSLFKMFYPIKYQESVSITAEKYNLEPSLVYSIIRCESGFKEDAQSHAQAIGLMQVMPDTFSWLKNSDDSLPDVDVEMLYETATNIEYGCYYVRYLLDHFGNEKTAIAAYNAGPGNVEKWLENPDYSSNGIDLDNIPIDETRNYVKRVFSSKEVYDHLYFNDDNKENGGN